MENVPVKRCMTVPKGPARAPLLLLAVRLKIAGLMVGAPPKIWVMVTGTATAVSGGENPRIAGGASLRGSVGIGAWLIRLQGGADESRQPSFLIVEGGGLAAPCKCWPSAPAFGGCGIDRGLPGRRWL